MRGKRSEYDMKAIGEKLKFYRESMNLTVEQVRQYMCLSSVQAIYKWEKGTSFPTLDNFFALTELYEVNPFDVLVKKDSISESEEKKDYIWIECHQSKKAYKICV